MRPILKTIILSLFCFHCTIQAQLEKLETIWQYSIKDSTIAEFNPDHFLLVNDGIVVYFLKNWGDTIHIKKFDEEGVEVFAYEQEEQSLMLKDTSDNLYLIDDCWIYDTCEYIFSKIG